ncbi:MAG: hypothetical protein ACREMP_03740 [Candidatus Tyrphobacter sp.]
MKCCAHNARGETCGQPATFACSELHVLCPNHAVKTTGRRRTDRRCRVCMKEGRVNDVVNLRDLRSHYAAHAGDAGRSGECAAAYDSLHSCRRRAVFVCSNGHGSCRAHVGLQVVSETLVRACSICGGALANCTQPHPAIGLLSGT